MHTRTKADRILQFGGSSGIARTRTAYVTAQESLVVYDTVEEFDLSTLSWVPKHPMKVPRFCSNAVILPTGKIFIHGGGANNPVDGTPGWFTWVGPAFLPELYDPGIGPSDLGSTTWLASPQPGLAAGTGQPFQYTPRVYHSIALLRPDGSVFIAGGEELGGDVQLGMEQNRNFTAITMATSQASGEVYFPPYYTHAARTTLTSLPDQVRLSNPTSAAPFKFEVSPYNEEEFELSKVVVIRPGAVTHHFDGDQRYVEIDFSNAGTDPLTQRVAVNAFAPDQALAPPGYYMVFVVLRGITGTLSQGLEIPSFGAWIKFI